MALGTERRQASLIGGGDLPSARLANTTPDLSGIARLGTSILNVDADNRARADAEARQKQALLDEMEGQKAGSEYGQAWVGKDANGNPVEVQLPMERSASFLRGYLNGFDQTQDGKFRASLETGLNAIHQRQIAGEITASEATALMQSFVDGATEGAPAHRKGYYSELGQTELMQRSTLMGTQEASRKAETVVRDLTASIEDEVNRASAHASAGGDPEPFLSRIDAAYDSLFDMGRIGETEMKLGKQGARELVVGQALVNRLTTALAKGEISPDELAGFGVAIETNNSEAEAVVNKTYQVGPMAKSSVPQGYRSKDVIAKITDEKLRQQMGQKMRQAAADFEGAARANAKATDYVATVQRLSTERGRREALPPAMRDTADEHGAAAMANTDPYRDPEARKGLLQLLASTKYVPKAVANDIRLKASSSNPEHIAEAIALYRDIAYLRNDWGDTVGTMLRETIPEDVRNLLEPMDAAFRAGVSPEQIARNMLEARGKDEFTLPALRREYELVKDEPDSFYKGFRTRFADTYGVPPDPEALGMFEQAFRHTAIMSRNPETAYEKAWEMVTGKFRKSDITMTGFETGSGTLTNPPGYEVRAPGGLMGPAAGSEYEWINESLRADVLELLDAGTIVLPPGADGREMDAAAFRSLFGSSAPPPAPDKGVLGNAWDWLTTPYEARTGGEAFLGKTAKLMPVPGSNPDAPEYTMMIFDREGNYLGPVMHAGKDGNVRPLIVNPHLEWARASEKGNARLDLEAVEKGTAAQLDRLDTDTLLKLPDRDINAYDGKIPLGDYLETVAPELAREYQLERKIFEDGLKGARETYEKKTGEKVEPADIGPQTLVQPKASGYSVAAAAAKAVDAVLPDGTGGTFLLRIAAQESNFGMAPGTFRLSGDRGMTQVNDGSGFVEIQRRIASGKGPVWAANEKLKAQLGIDMGKATAADLDKPVYAMAAARLYAEVVGKPIPADIPGQARWWKRHYNTVAGAGAEQQFAINAKKVPDQFTIEPLAGELAPDIEVGFRYANEGAKRNLPVTPTLATKMKDAVSRVFGEGYTIEVFSGGQTPPGKKVRTLVGYSRGYTGSRRHGVGPDGMGGRAADVYIYGPDGKKVRDPKKLKKLGQFWKDNGYGSVGMFMKDFGIHLDEFTEDQLKPGESLAWSY